MVVKVTARTRKAVGTGTRTAPAKKAPTRAPAKRAAPVVQDTPVKRGPGRPKKVVEGTSLPSLQERRESANPKKRIAGLSYKELSDLIGYGLGSEQFIVAVEVMKGGESRLEVSKRVSEMLPARTRNGSPKPVSNMVSAVVKRMEDAGFTVKGTWSMVRPAA